MAIAPYRVHRLIQDLMRDPEAAKAFAVDPQPAFIRYALEARDIVLLLDGSFEAMTELGVHPNLQMKYLRLRTPPPGSAGLVAAGPLDSYLAKLLER